MPPGHTDQKMLGVRIVAGIFRVLTLLDVVVTRHPWDLAAGALGRQYSFDLCLAWCRNLGWRQSFADGGYQLVWRARPAPLHNNFFCRHCWSAHSG